MFIRLASWILMEVKNFQEELLEEVEVVESYGSGHTTLEMLAEEWKCTS